ncbi:MAG: transposase [Candidatus Thiodiazotropha sp. (ex Lucinoma aequizonata)]|nr:transposase [Candidatus Thiodiazotropha sp. (ex Lucinoma aequizonata)]MCU7904108.1 transposase [Candidatus Thiodiazotropha sp. (ex Lucinoma aequizonata)]
MNLSYRISQVYYTLTRGNIKGFTMKKNTIQFQKWFSLPDFFKTYGREEQCEKALFDWRWPRGFVCPECGHIHHCL